MFIDRLDDLRIKGLQNKEVLIGPKSVNIHITGDCNLNCMFCWDRSPLLRPKNPKGVHLDYRSLKNVISDCADIGVQSICLEGGEVFLYPKIAELCGFIKSKGLSLEVYSNCAFGKPMRQLFRFIDRVNVNLSAVNSGQYQRVHGLRDDAVFGRVIGNLLYLSKMKNKTGRPWVQLIYVINNLNFEGVRSFIGLGKKLNADHIKFKLMEATKETRPLLLTPGSAAALDKELSRIKGKASMTRNNIAEIRRLICGKDFMKRMYSIGKSAWHNDRFFYFDAFNREEIRCCVGWFYGFIDLKGRVVAPCDNVGVSFMGDIHRQSFKKIWFSKKFKRFRRDTFDHLDPGTKKWRECRYCGFIDFNKAIMGRLDLFRKVPRQTG